MGWVSPTGFVDPDTIWNLEPDAYDEDTLTYAYENILASRWGHFLELTHAAINCDKVRFFCKDGWITEIDLDVYYEDGWHHVFEGEHVGDEWEEKSIPAGVKSVTAAKVKFYNNSTSTISALLYEFDFWEVVVGWTGKISGVTNPAKIMGVDVANIAKVKGVASA